MFTENINNLAGLLEVGLGLRSFIDFKNEVMETTGPFRIGE